MGLNMARILGVVFGVLGLVISLAMGVNIQTQNATIQSANQTNLIGLSVLDDWGAPLVILGILSLSALFTYGSIKGTYVGSGVKDLMIPVGASILAIIGLSMMTNVITYSNNLIGAVATDAEDIIWGIIPLVVYVVIIGLPTAASIKTYRGMKGGKASASSVGF